MRNCVTCGQPTIDNLGACDGSCNGRDEEAQAQEKTAAAVEAALAADREAALRDVFAAAALGAILAHTSYSNPRMQAVQCRDAYSYADLMLEVRKEGR